MFTENDLRDLLSFTAPEPVLSVYLNTNPTEGNADAYRLHLRNMLKRVNLPQDVTAIENYFSHQYDWSGRGVAVFSCAPRGFFHAYPLAVPVRNRLHVSDRPGVRPLADLLDSFGGYGVVLADQQGARLFYFHLGELREQEGTVGDPVKRIKRGGASSVHGQRAGNSGKTGGLEEIVDRNTKDIADFSIHFFEENHVRRILIGGSEDNVARLRASLPKAWQSLVMGTFSMPITASHTEVLTRAMQIGQSVESKREAKLVQDMITTTAKGGPAVTGLDRTLDAINNGRVQMLLVSEGYSKPGYRCKDCDSLAASEVGCEPCGGTAEKVMDVIDLAVSAVMRGGGDVEVVHDNAELTAAGNIGALLRY